MPLRDHFRPPIWNRYSWEGFHGMWPAMIVQQLDRVLPADFTAEPRVHLGAHFEIDVCAYEDDERKRAIVPSADDSSGVATATWAPPQPTLSVDTELVEQYEYEVKVYDQSRGRVLVAAVEIVSPANKDRLESRRALVTKCAALLQQDVCVSIVDLVTTRNFNLYTDLLALLDLSDPAFAPPPPAVVCSDVPRAENRTRDSIRNLGQSTDGRPAVADSADVVSRGIGRFTRFGSQLRRNLPRPPHGLTLNQPVPSGRVPRQGFLEAAISVMFGPETAASGPSTLRRRCLVLEAD